MLGEINFSSLLASMSPVLQEGEFFFASIKRIGQSMSSRLSLSPRITKSRAVRLSCTDTLPINTILNTRGGLAAKGRK